MEQCADRPYFSLGYNGTSAFIFLLGARPLSAPRFFSASALPREPLASRHWEVDEATARHWQVLRLNVGDAVTLFDGCGGEWHATIETLEKRRASALLTAFDAVERESPIEITLVQALAMGDKMDFIVQKAVELGVSTIIPVTSERTTLKLVGDRADKRSQHWRAVAVAACEQCGRNRVPQIAPLVDWSHWLKAYGANASDGTTALMFHPDAAIATQSFGTALRAANPKRVAILIGPEGGWSPGEVAAAIAAGVKPVRAGPRVLRTETAGLAAVAALNALLGDLR